MFIIDDLVSGLINKSNVDSTNNMNAQIAAANRKFQERMFHEANDFNNQQREAQNVWNAAQVDKQNSWNAAQVDKANQWNLQQWNRQNSYNSPLAQKQRMLDAGLNPYLSGIQTGSAQSSPQSGAAQGSASQGSPVSSVSPPQGSTYTAQTPPPLQLSASGFLDLGSYFNQKNVSDANARKTNAEAQEQEIRNKNAAARSLYELQLLQNNVKGSGLQNFYQGIMNDIAFQTKQYQIDSAYWNTQQLKQGYDLNDIQIKASQINLDYLPQEKKLNLAYQGQMLSNAVLQGQLTKAQAYYQWSAAADMAASAEGRRLDNRVKRATFNDVVLGVHYDTDIKHSNAKAASWLPRKAYYDSFPDYHNVLGFANYLGRDFNNSLNSWIGSNSDALRLGIQKTVSEHPELFQGRGKKPKSFKGYTKFNYGTGKYY